MRQIITFILILFSINVFAQREGKIKKISPAKLERKLKKQIQLVDVRTPKEFSENCINQAKNINVESADFEQQLSGLDKKKPVYVYCRTGKRSDKAAQKMAKMGFKKIYDVEGGVTAWDKEKSLKKK